jgi:peptidoglycan/xylan/chitin deacetylase (PgdA/CDA1 family)
MRKFIMRKFIKDLGLNTCLLLGQLYHPPGIPILVYHSVADDNSNISISPEMFAFQMFYLKNAGYKVVSFSQLISLIDKDNSLPQKTVVLTFDDGLKDFYISAWPVLRRYNFSATVFVATNYIGGKSLWYADYNLSPVPMLDWKELKELDRAGIDIQSHSCSHQPLTELGSKELQKELSESKKVLENGLGHKVDVFCCPQGAEDNKVAAAIKNAGYRAGIGGQDGLFNVNDDSYTLKRQSLDYITIKDKKTALLSIKACLQGTFAWYVKIRKGVKKNVKKIV